MFRGVDKLTGMFVIFIGGLVVSLGYFDFSLLKRNFGFILRDIGHLK